MTPEETHRDSGNGTATAGLTGTDPGPGQVERQPGEASAGSSVNRQGWRPTPPLWSALVDRVRAEVGSSGVSDALIWLALIAALGLYGWYVAAPREDVEEAPLEIESRADADIAPMAAEQAALERQVAEARVRIAELEEKLQAERQRNDAARQAESNAKAAPRRPPSLAAELGGRETERGILVDLADSDLSFPIGKATLPDRDFPILERIASVLVQHPSLSARVEGHTDSAGREAANLALSQARAEAVKQTLVGRGVRGGRIEAVGLGETRPIADNATRAGRDRNRRIEVYLDEGPD